jgi:hypothetical protein
LYIHIIFYLCTGVFYACVFCVIIDICANTCMYYRKLTKMEQAQEDLENAKKLTDSITSSRLFKSIDNTPRKQTSSSIYDQFYGSSSSSASRDDDDENGGDNDASSIMKKEKWSQDAVATMKRLDAAVLGSLAVCLFKTDLIRNGGAGVMNGMAYGMQRLLRSAEQKYPTQVQLLSHIYACIICL